MNDDVSYGSSGPVIGGTLTDRLLTSQLTDAIIKENSIASDIPSWFTTGLAGSVIGDEISFGEQGNISLETAKEQILKFDYKSNEISKMTTKAGILAVGYLHTLDTDGDSVSEWSSLMNEMKTAPTFEAAIQAAYGQPLHTIIDQMKQDTGVAANAGSGALATFFDNKMGYRIGDHNADSLIDAGSLEDSVANAGVASSINDSGDVITYNGYQIKLDWPDYKQQNTMMVHLGTSATEFLQFGIGDMSANGILGSSFEVELSTQKGAQEAISVIKEGIEYVSGERSRIGAVQNRLEHASKNLLQTSENTQNAESRIRDIDMASEMVSYSKNKILMQAGQSMLAQANQQNQGILSLIQ